jgi:alpha-L-fucosidase
MNDQLTELLTNYGEIGGIWFDGWWDKKDADWQLEKQYELIHQIQPGCLVGNNHHLAPKSGEDFQMFEKDLPGHNTTGFSGESQIGNLPLEMCETMNGSWGYRITDKKFKSSKDLIHLLVKNAGYNSNFLLNVGPQPDGLIQQEFIDTLAKIGNWMNKNGNSIYGTRGGVYPVQDWGVVTKKDNMHYIHIIKMPTGNRLFLGAWPQKPKSVKLFSNGRSLPFKHTSDGLLLMLDPKDFDGIDMIVEVIL